MSDRKPRRRRRRRRSRGQAANPPPAQDSGDSAPPPSDDSDAEPAAAGRRGARGDGKRRARPQTVWGIPRTMFMIGIGLIFMTIVVFILPEIVSSSDDDDRIEFTKLRQFPDQGRRHLTAGATFDSYNSFPPTSGPQAEEGSPPGIYGPDEPAPFDVPPAPAEFLPLLELGGLVFYYDPGALPSSDAEELRAFVAAQLDLGRNVALAPIEQLAQRIKPAEASAPIIAAAWRHHLLIQALDEEGAPIPGLDDAGAEQLRAFAAPDPDGYYERFILDPTAREAALRAPPTAFSDRRLRRFDDELIAADQQHLPPGEPISYPASPPYGGSHWEIPTPCGVYAEQQAFEGLVHTMEHGAVIIYYQPDVFSPDEVNELRTLVLDLLADDRRIILTPNQDISSPLTLTAWGAILELDRLEEETVPGFVNAFENRGPERFSREQAC